MWYRMQSERGLVGIPLGLPCISAYLYIFTRCIHRAPTADVRSERQTVSDGLVTGTTHLLPTPTC